MPTIQVVAICITVLIACFTTVFQAGNAYVKSIDIDGVKLRLDKAEDKIVQLDMKSSEFSVIKNEMQHITALLNEIKEGLNNKQDKIHGN